MTKPDWKNFGKAVLDDWPTNGLPGDVLFDLALQYGMIQEVTGGYNPDHHIDAEGFAPEEGDPWYEYTFQGRAGLGLYSMDNMIGEKTKLAKQENIIAAGKEMYETAMLTGGGSPVAWTAYVKARNIFGDTLAELKGGKDE